MAKTGLGNIVRKLAPTPPPALEFRSQQCHYVRAEILLKVFCDDKVDPCSVAAAFTFARGPEYMDGVSNRFGHITVVGLGVSTKYGAEDPKVEENETNAVEVIAEIQEKAADIGLF